MFNGKTREQGYLHEIKTAKNHCATTIKRGTHDSDTPVICKRYPISFEKHQTAYANLKK